MFAAGKTEYSGEIGPETPRIGRAPSGIIRPRRPDYGLQGSRIRLLVNMYPVKFDSSIVVYHYDVDIVPSTTAAIKRRVFTLWVNQESAGQDMTLQKFAKLCVYDGQKNLFAPKSLEIDSRGRTFEIELREGASEKPQIFKVAIKEVAQLDLHVLTHYLSNEHPANISVKEIYYPRDRISALEVLFRHVPSLNFATFGRGGGSFFSNVGASPLRHGLTVHFGWYQSLRPSVGPIQGQGTAGDVVTYKQLLLNMDVAATAFYQAGPLPQVVANFFGESNINSCRRYLNDSDKMFSLQRHLKNVTVDISYRSGRNRYKIRGLSRGSAAETMIDLEEPPRRISVAEFFKEHYNINLQLPWLPCINAGTKKDVFLPMELCSVRENQRHMGKLSDLQVADMIKVTAIPPGQRQQRIQKGIEALHGRNDASFLKSWGVEVGNDLVSLPGRVLPPPKMTFHPQSQGGHTIPVRDGTWRYGQGRSLAVPASLDTWGVAVFAGPNQVQERDVERFLKGLVSSLQDLGMKVNTRTQPRDLITYARRSESPEDTLAEAHRQIQKTGPRDRKVDMIICILLSPSSSVYSAIKRTAETRIGVLTQCCLSKHVRDDPGRKRPYYANLGLKINAKLGGVNAFLNPNAELPPVGPSRVPTMIIGADVTHPPPGAETKSIAALVASMDSRYCEYRASIRLQEGGKEIITEIADMVKELFLQFRDRHKVFPQRIVMYRDGVSEGQFGEVVWNEITTLKRMFGELCGDKIPTVTFIVMNKRHHVRFFATNREDADNKGNLRPGTVVDSDVTHPFEFDFFLYSHAGLQGTSRPCHYHVLYDENGFNSDTMQALTYRLCYLFCRSTRVVSMVPSAYYAHLLAARARCYIDGGASGMENVISNISKSMYFV